MPQQKRNGFYGITWAEVGEVIDAVEAESHCRVELHIVRAPISKSNAHRLWTVQAVAVRYPGRPDQCVGVGGCTVGGNRGASSFQGAAINAVYEAQFDMGKRLANKRYDRDNPPERLPGF